jgi:hypothetical protein
VYDVRLGAVLCELWMLHKGVACDGAAKRTGATGSPNPQCAMVVVPPPPFTRRWFPPGLIRWRHDRSDVLRAWRVMKSKLEE